MEENESQTTHTDIAIIPDIGNVDAVSKKDPTTRDDDSIAKMEEFNAAPGRCTKID